MRAFLLIWLRRQIDDNRSLGCRTASSCAPLTPCRRPRQANLGHTRSSGRYNVLSPRILSRSGEGRSVGSCWLSAFGQTSIGLQFPISATSTVYGHHRLGEARLHRRRLTASAFWECLLFCVWSEFSVHTWMTEAQSARSPIRRSTTQATSGDQQLLLFTISSSTARSIVTESRCCHPPAPRI